MIRCTCSNSSGPVSVVANLQSAGKNPMKHDLDDHMESNIELCESSHKGSGELLQFNDEGWELGSHPDGIDTEDGDGNIMFEMPTSFQAEDFFTKENVWPAPSRDYFINEHNNRS